MLIFIWVFFAGVTAAFGGIYLHERQKAHSNPRLTKAPAIVASVWTEVAIIRNGTVDKVEIVSNKRLIVLTYDHGSVGGLKSGDQVTFARTADGTPMWLKTKAGKEYDTMDNPKSQAFFFLFITCFMGAISAIILTAMTVDSVRSKRSSRESREWSEEMIERIDSRPAILYPREPAETAPPEADLVAPPKLRGLSYRRLSSKSPSNEEET